MSDYIVKRLRDLNDHMNTFILDEAADRIEKLEAGEEEWNRICNRYAARIDKLEAALLRAIEDIEFWGAYVSEYFQDKHDLKSSIQNARKALEGKDD